MRSHEQAPRVVNAETGLATRAWVAAGSGGALEGALLWERLGTAGRGRLRGREIQIGPWTRHVSVVISSALFIVLGIAFIVFQGGNALGGVYAALGAPDLALAIETAVRDLATDSPLALAAIVTAPVVLILVLLLRSRRGGRPNAPETQG
jgi:hypothetical protein